MWLDRLIIGGITFLILFTPLAFGSGHPWAYSLMEAVIFFLSVLAAVKLFLLRDSGRIAAFSIRPLVLPLVLLTIFTLFQLLPLPPSLLRAISPSTYEVYTHSLRGWPERPPYSDLLTATAAHSTADKETRGEGDKESPTFFETWIPLSLAPELTRIDLLRFIASVALFFLLLLYPFGIGRHRLLRGRTTPDTGIRFYRSLLYAVMFSGFVVAILGFLNLFTWNGKILWFFEPYDQSAGATGATRAAGPFINPDHFANYLAMVFPLLITGTVFRSFLTPQKFEAAFRVLCGFAAFIVVGSLLLSLSRGGWGGTVLGTIVLLSLMARGKKTGNRGLARAQARRLRGLAIAAAGISVVGVLLFVGSQGRRQLDLRLDQTMAQTTNLARRLLIWRDAWGMVRDFPLMGVGLGAWPELFPRYQNPQIGGFAREAHNDYLEFLSEAGLIGFALLAWFFWECLRRIFGALNKVDRGNLPVAAALLAGISAMAFHEFFDFNLQIPANALLFTVFLAIALRLSLVARPERQQGGGGEAEGRANKRETRTGEKFRFVIFDSRKNRGFGAVLLGLVAACLLFAAFNQDRLPYPHSLRSRPPVSVEQAVQRIRDYPAQAQAHLDLSKFLGTSQQDHGTKGQPDNQTNGQTDTGIRGQGDLAEDHDTTGQQGKEKKGQREKRAFFLDELRTALWLEPKRTGARDIFAVLLLKQGKLDEGLQEVTRSVMDAPFMSDHFYLSKDSIPLLDPPELDAIEKGFQRAVAAERPGALDQLGRFYTETERFVERAALYESAASDTMDSELKSKYIFEAASSSVAANEFEKAEKLFRQAVAIAPGDPRPYQELILQIYGPREDISAARAVVAEAIKAGAGGFDLFLSLASIAHTAGDAETAKQALIAAKEIAAGADGTNQLKQYVTVFRAAREAQEHELAKSFLEEMAKVTPSTFPALYGLGNLYLLERNFDRAAYYYARAVRQNPASAAAFYRLALVEERRFQYGEAKRAYETAIKLDPGNTKIQERYEAFKEKLAAR